LARIVITEFMDDAAVAFLSQRHAVHHDPELPDKPGELAGRVVEADALIVRNRTQVRGDLLAAAVRLRCIGRLGVGLDNIDVDACKARGIEVIPATGANAESVAEYVVCTAMVLLRGAFFSTRAVEAGTWPRQTLSQGREVAGKVMGIVGYGSIGRLTARKAEALGMQVMSYDSVAGDASTRDLELLLRESDVVSLHVPLTPETRGLLDARRLALMKRDAVLVNTARGGIVDEAALAAMLREGRLRGAALDVFDQEPLAAGSSLTGAPRLILTPHIAGVTLEANERVSALIAERVADALDRL
jgi:(S)-sulfolactate dehydrogenase